MFAPRDLGEVLVFTAKLLTFRRVVPDLKRLGPLYLTVGLLFTWAAGIGRYWDNPRAHLWQHLGLGSLAYVFLLALLLWLLFLPWRPNNWRYFNILVFISLTSPPAIFYAIPVERFMSLGSARLANVIFLLVVAVWRVLLLWFFLRRAAGLSRGETIVAVFLPITLIVTALTFLNLEHAVFDLMAGLRPEDYSANDSAYGVLFAVTLVSILAFPLLLIIYLVLCSLKWRGFGQ